MSHYKPYPVYKDSGVEWIGDVPEHWKLSKVAWDMKMSIGWTPPTGNRSYYGGTHNWVSIADLSAGRVCNTKQTITDAAVAEMRGTQAPAGSLLFSYKLSLGEVALLEYPAYTNEAIAAFHPCKRVHMPFWKYAAPVILPKYSRENIYGSDLLNQELMNSARMYLPDTTEQESIALGLDRETTRIDALITKKTRFIELLKEKRQALITHAITKGLDPNVKMKDSKVEWIGDVPEHWLIQPVKQAFATQLGKMISPKPSSEDDLFVPYHRAQTVQWERVEHGQVERMWASKNEIVSYCVGRGDLLICEGGDVCRAAICDIEPVEPTIIQNSIHRVRSRGTIKVEWLLQLMKLIRSSEWIDVLCNKNTIVHFTSEKLNNLRIPIPPPEEHYAILDHLTKETVRIDILIAKTQHSIDLLKERSSAFITAAVTGKIDLRNKNVTKE